MPQPLRVLIVDDDQGMAASLSALLNTSGHQTLTANSAADARQLLDQTGPVDVAIVNYFLGASPSGDVLGRELLDRPLPVILVSGYDRDHLGDLGADFLFLPKPHSWEQLQATLSQAVGRRV